jgi:hypothetical protein
MRDDMKFGTCKKTCQAESFPPLVRAEVNVGFNPSRVAGQSAPYNRARWRAKKGARIYCCALVRSQMQEPNTFERRMPIIKSMMPTGKRADATPFACVAFKKESERPIE